MSENDTVNTPRTQAKKLCQHCDRRPISRPRRLCFNCYENYSIRDLYPSRSPRPLADDDAPFVGLRLPEPTSAIPGTEEKIVVLAERAQKKLSVFHPDDMEEQIDRQRLYSVLRRLSFAPGSRVYRPGSIVYRKSIQDESIYSYYEGPDYDE